MFRRGTCLPARPSVPNKDEILEDLVSACYKDVIYEFNEENSSNGSKIFRKTSENDNLNEAKGVALSYLKIDSFLDKINYLKHYLMNLQEQKVSLKSLEDNLLQDMFHIKKELRCHQF